jgi:hypothetical protein
MTKRLITTALLLGLLTGCKSVDGTYYPGCMAFEGSKISLEDGRYVWEKFTDQVAVDDEGKVINRFPEYPKQGMYRIDGQTLVMSSDNGEPDVTLHIHQRDGSYLLLTASQNTMFEQTGRYDDCVLTRQGTLTN